MKESLIESVEAIRDKKMLSKKQQTKRGSRLRDDEVIKEPKYLKFLHEDLQPRCFVCNVKYGIQLHHIKRDSTSKRIDKHILPLCYEHHHGFDLSPHGNPKKFREMYPIEEQLKHAEKLYNKFKGK